jgi:hypothetical protein
MAYAVPTANSKRGNMNHHPSFKRIAAAGFGAALLAAAAPALADPPGRIARLAYVSGPVSFAPAGENDWESAALNSTLIAGDRLWVDAGARDEVQVGGAALRMDGGTLVTLADIDDRLTRLQMSQGRLNVRVRKVAPNEVFEIDTPNLALTIRQPGDYRIEVDPAGNVTTVAVRRGQADAYGGGNAYRLGNGQAYSFGGSDLRDARYARAGVDDFDRWSAARDRRLEQSRAARYVSPSLVGYEDLDEQGTWRSMPSYGNVWMPANVGRDWAPYRDGHWSYVQPWGWTWVDDAPWGFAVSHYGRWARFPQGWGWVPGPRAASPVYAPALVAFVSIGAGAYSQRERPVAWVPLAPREVYRPSYRASPAYVTSINVTNTTLARNQIPREHQRVDYANRRVGGAVTAVPQAAFVRAQPVSKAALALPMAAVAGAAIANAAPPAPERVRGHGNGGHQPPPAVVARQAQSAAAPPPALRHAPTPVPPPAAAQPAPIDRAARRDEMRQGRDQRALPAPPLAHAPTPLPLPAQAAPVPPNDAMRHGGDRHAAPTVAAPVPPPDRAARREEMRQAREQRPPAPLAHAPVPAAAAPVAPPAPPVERAAAREERRQMREQRPPAPPPLAHAPTPVAPPPLAHAPTPVAPPAAAPVPPVDRGARREEMRHAREQQRQERPAPQATPAPPPAPVATPRPPEPPPLRHAPTPAAAAAPPPPPPLAAAAAAAPPPAEPPKHGHNDDGKKGEKRDRQQKD